MTRQLGEISNQLKPSQNIPPLPGVSVPTIQSVPQYTAIAPPCAPLPASVPPTLAPPHLSQVDVSAIESAKCTLNFSPITCDDLDRMKKNECEDVTQTELLTRALHEFLDVNMSIPVTTISKMVIKKIWHSQELEFQKISVEFSNICPVNTIFKYVKNLDPEQKVSIFIPTVLEALSVELNNIAYHLRNSEPRQKTVIKYYGYSLALYSKTQVERNWRHVPIQSALPCPPAKPRKRSRATNDTDDDIKRPNKDAIQTTIPTSTQNAQPSLCGIPKPSFNLVPCHSKPKPSPCLTPVGGYWSADDPRSPAPKQPEGNSQVTTMGPH